jgi:cysteine-rich repeat protein
VENIHSIYNEYRYGDPLQWECQKLNKETFKEQQSCMQETLCDTRFTTYDSYHLANVLETSTVFRDRNTKQLLNILERCGKDNDNVTRLKEELLSRGFVLCFDDVGNETETVTQAIRLIASTKNGEGEVHVLANASVCKTAGSSSTKAIAILSNGTNAVNREELCEGHPTHFTLQCPVCANSVLELPAEECDDGNTVDGDGCSASCTIEQAFLCTAVPWKTSACRHYDIDLNKFDNTTRNRTVVFFHRKEVVFLADNRTLDSRDYGNTDWDSVKLTLVGTGDGHQEKLGLQPFIGAAVLSGRLTLSDGSFLNQTSVLYEYSHDTDGTLTTVITRKAGNKVYLTHVLLALAYMNGGEPDHVPRLILIDVLDVNGLSAPPVAVTLIYVGENVNAPVITVSQKTARYVVGSNNWLSVTNGSLRVFDVDHEYYPMQSGKVEILHAGHRERLYLEMENSEILVLTNENATTITLHGTASTETYADLFNNVTYFSWESNTTELGDIVVSFEVNDGVHSNDIGQSSIRIEKGTATILHYN